MRPSLRTASLLLWLGTVPVAAQTTPTERQAAGPVVAQIEALQADIRPTELAQRLAGAHVAEKEMS